MKKIKITKDEYTPCTEHGGKHMIRRTAGTMNGKFVSVTQEKGSGFEAVAQDKNGRPHELVTKSIDDLISWFDRVTGS